MVSSIIFFCLYFLFFSVYWTCYIWGGKFWWQELTRAYLLVCTENLLFTAPINFVLRAQLCIGSAWRGRVCVKKITIIWFK